MRAAALAIPLLASVLAAGGPAPKEGACAPCLQAHLEFLASDALNGRASASRDEWIAATYAAAQFRQWGLEPAGEDGTYFQRIALVQPELTGPVTLAAGEGAAALRFTHGREMAAMMLHAGQSRGALRKLSGKGPFKVQPEDAVLLPGDTEDEAFLQGVVGSLMEQGPRLVLVPRGSNWQRRWARPARLDRHRKGAAPEGPSLVLLGPEAMAQLQALPDGTAVALDAPSDKAAETATWNVLARIPGRREDEALLFGAHLDHLGEGKPVNGDAVYNGADDDASGCAAVLEVARWFTRQPKPRRTLVFALFGSEEIGLVGSQGFLAKPTFPLERVVANLDFEMLGRPDAKTPGKLWLTGFERTDLGEALAAHGAALVGDPHPEMNFFMRSDNLSLARRGIVAQTVSSYGLHGDYHQPSDDLAHLDLPFFTRSVDAMLEPLRWLADTEWRPSWKPGGRP